MNFTTLVTTSAAGLALTGFALAGALVASNTAHAAPKLINCKPYKNCNARNKPCQRTLRPGQTLILRGSNAAGAPKIGRSAIRVRLCDGVNATCSSGIKSQNVQVFARNGRTYVLQVNLSTNFKTDTGGHSALPVHTQFGVTCTSIGSSCRIAWQHCRYELPLTAPSQRSKGKPRRGLKTN